MKTIRILSVRKNTDSRVQSLETDYIRRLRGTFKIESEDIRQTYSGDLAETRVLEKEALMIEKKIEDSDAVVCLHESGKAYSSREFSSWLMKKSETSKRIVFVLGGPYGLHPKLLDRSQETLSLSRMTFTHEFSRLILLEALFRAVEISRGSAYHK